MRAAAITPLGLDELCGSGYVLPALPRADRVERLGWLTERQLLDAMARRRGSTPWLDAVARRRGSTPWRWGS